MTPMILDDFLDPRTARACAAEFPGPEDPRWVRYNNADQQKLAMPLKPGPTLGRVINELNSEAFTAMLGRWLEIRERLICDPSLWGGGLHLIEPGGYLAMHRDKSRDPHTGLRRRLNLILFVEPRMDPEHGQLWLDGRPIGPRFNRLVVFSPDAHHGHPKPLPDESPSRKSLALYYYTPWDGSEERTRADFGQGGDA